MEDKLNEMTIQQALLVGLALAGVYYFMVFKSTNPKTQIAQIKNEIAQYEGEIRKFDKKIEEGEKLKEQIEVLEKDLSVKFSYVPENVTDNEIYQSLSVEARSVGLGIESISENATWVRLTSLEYLEVPVALTGDFNQVMKFLSGLTRLKKLMVIDTFEITSSAGTPSVENTDKARPVTFNVSIKVYRKIPGGDQYKPNAGGEPDNV